MIIDTESKMGEVIDKYIVFVNDKTKIDQYKEIKKSFSVSKLNLVIANDNFIFHHGFDTVYNNLRKYSKETTKSTHVLILFDTDIVEVDLDALKKELEIPIDLYSYKMYMQRGDVWEDKYQLYSNDGFLNWYGLVHENQIFTRQYTVGRLNNFRVLHHNALDKFSKELKKTQDGFIILEKTDEGTDSDKRNMLYESLVWKIVNAGGRHINRNWFLKHYEINKELIDWYYNRARIEWEKL
jgi:hypothetical protein